MATRHLLLMFFICIVWGGTFVAGKAGVGEFPPILFTALRYVLLAVLLAPFLKPVAGYMPQIIIVSMTMGGLHFALFYGGMSVAENVSSIAVVAQLGVPFSTILSIVFLSEQVGWRRWLGIALAFLGATIIGFDPAMVHERLGLALVVLAVFIGAVGMVVMKRVSATDTGIYQIQAWIAWFSFPLLIAVSAITESGQIEAIQNAGYMGWGGVVYTALGASLVGHAGMYYLLQRYDVSVTAPLTLLAPVFGVVFGVLIWGDVLNVRFWIGGSMTLLGVLIIGLRKREHPPAGAVL